MADKHEQVVVITGASAGVGRATAERFARDGAAIALIARGEAGLEGARRDVEAAGGRALVCPADVSDPWAVDTAAARAEQELGPIDVWVNCATVTVLGQFEQLTMDEFRRVTEVTYLGAVYGTHAALRRMLPRDAGTIVQVGTSLAQHGIPLQSAYCGAKHAVHGFTNSVRSELVQRGSRIWMIEVHLPMLNTPQLAWSKNKLERQSQPLGPIYQPEVAAEAVHFAAHEHRRELWVGVPKAAPARQSDGPQSASTRYNLWQPVDDVADQGAHGPLDRRAHAYSAELYAAKHKKVIAAGLLTAAILGLGSALLRR